MDDHLGGVADGGVVAVVVVPPPVSGTVLRPGEAAGLGAGRVVAVSAVVVAAAVAAAAAAALVVRLFHCGEIVMRVIFV